MEADLTVDIGHLMNDTQLNNLLSEPASGTVGPFDDDPLNAFGLHLTDTHTDQLGLSAADTTIFSHRQHQREPQREADTSAAPSSARNSLSATDDSPRDWKDLQLVISKHSVHKVELDEETNEQMYVVSNLRKFKIEVQLVEKQSGMLAIHNHLRLQAVLLYENGCVVKSGTEKLLTGETEVVVIKGAAIFKLQMGQSVLTSKLGKQCFRIRLEPVDETLREKFTTLVALTEPLKSVTKLERKPPPPQRIGMPPCSPPQQLSSMQQMHLHNESMPGIRHATAHAPLASQAYTTSMPPLYPHCGMEMGHAMPNGMIPAATAVGNCHGVSANPSPPNHLVSQLDAQSLDRRQMEEVVRLQKMQIEQLATSNQELMQELANLRSLVVPAPQRHVAARSYDAEYVQQTREPQRHHPHPNQQNHYW